MLEEKGKILCKCSVSKASHNLNRPYLERYRFLLLQNKSSKLQTHTQIISLLTHKSQQKHITNEIQLYYTKIYDNINKNKATVMYKFTPSDFSTWYLQRHVYTQNHVYKSPIENQTCNCKNVSKQLLIITT